MRPSSPRLDAVRRCFRDTCSISQGWAVRRYLAICSLCLALLVSAIPAWASRSLEQELGRLFVGHSFTIRGFYRGGHLRYGSDGQPLGKAEAGYWSRDGMVEISSVKLSLGELIMEGKRTCVLFDPAQGEFSNVRTGDPVEIEVQLTPDQLSFEVLVPLLQKVFLTSRDRLADLVPPYWADCLQRKVDRPDKHSLWECVTQDRHRVPDFAGKKVSWDIPPPDRTLRNGMQHYLLRHRVAYLSEPGINDPRLMAAPDPLFQWEQARISLGAMTLVLAITVGEDGRVRDILIVSPVGMGLDDEAAQSVKGWQLRPGTYQGKACTVHARVIFDITAPNAR